MTWTQSSLAHRPTRWDGVVGQSAVVKVLSSALRSGKISTSYVFLGPSGVGKTTVARILAAGLNCTDRDKLLLPCGECASCGDVAMGRSEHVIEVDAASDRGVATVEALQDTVNLMLPDNAWRVVILDEAHQLSAKAWGATLKMIEEPPPRNTFVFVTTEDGKIPHTVQTRSAVFNFKAIDEDVIAGYLESGGWHALNFEPGAANLIARESQGSLRAALQILDQIGHAITRGNNVSAAEVADLIGTFTGSDEQVAIPFANAILDRSVPAFYTALDRAIRTTPMDKLALLLAQMASDFYAARAGYTGRMKTGIPAHKMAKNAEHLPLEDLARLVDLTASFYASFLKTRVGLEAVFVRWVNK